MADMQPVNIPKPPANAHVDDLHQWATSLNIWLGQNMGSGLQTTLLSSNQLADVTEKKDAAKIFYNNDTHTFHASVIDSGNLVVKQFTLT
jgi:hypothetical protein